MEKEVGKNTAKMTLLARRRRRRTRASFIHVPRRARTVIYRRRIIYSHGTSPRVGYASCNNNDGTLGHKRADPSNAFRVPRVVGIVTAEGGVMHRPFRIPGACSLSVELNLMSFQGVARRVSCVFQRYPRERKRKTSPVLFVFIG